MFVPRSLLLLVASSLAACGPLKLDPASEAGTRTRDASAEPEDDGSLSDDAGRAAPKVTITAPQEGAMLDADTLRIEGTSSDERGVASVAVRVGPNQPIMAQTGDNYRTWWVEARAGVGTFSVEAVARDIDGEVSEPHRIMVVRPSSAPDDAAPTLAILEPENDSSPLHTLVLVRGTASDDRAVTAMRLLRTVKGVEEELTERPLETDDFFAHWSRLVPLVPGEQNLLTFIATDEAGHETRASLTLLGRAEADREAPMLSVLRPSEGEHVNAMSLQVGGTASDNKGIRDV